MPLHKYRVLRTCYWNLILWEPEKMKEPIVEIDTDTQGVPPYHFEPLDGGPVGPSPAPKPAGVPRLDLPRVPAPLDEPATLKGLQDSTAGQEPKFQDHDSTDAARHMPKPKVKS